MEANDSNPFVFKVISFTRKGKSKGQLRLERSQERELARKGREEERQKREKEKQERRQLKEEQIVASCCYDKSKKGVTKKKSNAKEQLEEYSCDEEIDVEAACFKPVSSKQTVSLIDTCEEHKLPIVAFNNKRKYKDYIHCREYGVVYNRDVEAYHYRGYDINPPNVGQQDIQPYNAQKRSTRWVQYFTHAELQKRIFPYRINYVNTDNMFVQLVLIQNLLACLFTLLCTLSCKFIQSIHKLLIYEIIWVPGFFGIIFSVYMILCSSSCRKFPCNYILLGINILSMTYMCAYITIYQDTFGVIVAVSCITFIAMIFLTLALCDVDFRKLFVLFLAVVLGLVIPIIFFKVLGSIPRTRKWVPRLDRHYNMMILGIATHSTSMILMLQLLIQNRTMLMPEDDYATGTFVVYMCEICMFMKLVSYMGLFDENHH